MLICFCEQGLCVSVLAPQSQQDYSSLIYSMHTNMIYSIQLGRCCILGTTMCKMRVYSMKSEISPFSHSKYHANGGISNSGGYHQGIDDWNTRVGDNLHPPT